MSTTTDLELFLSTVVPRQREADEQLHRGNPVPRMQLWSHDDPVTLLGAFGVAASGWERVSNTFRWLARRFSQGGPFQLDVIAAGVSGDLAYTVGYEHSVVSLDGEAPRPARLRVTHVYRRESGEWKIVHRHGDRLESDEVPLAQ